MIKSKMYWFLVYSDNLALLANTPAQAESLLPNQEKAARGIGIYMNSDKSKLMSFNQDGAISTLWRTSEISSHTSVAISHLLKVMSTYT